MKRNCARLYRCVVWGAASLVVLTTSLSTSAQISATRAAPSPTARFRDDLAPSASLADRLGLNRLGPNLVTLTGRVYSSGRDTDTRLRFRDTTGKIWVLVGPDREELDPLADRGLPNKVQILGRRGPFTVRDCNPFNVWCPEYDTFVIYDYSLVEVNGLLPTYGRIERRSSTDLAVGSQQFRWKHTPEIGATLATSIGCHAWATTIPVRWPDPNCSSQSACGKLRHWLVDGGVLRCGSDPRQEPREVRPAGDDILSCQVEYPQSRWYCRLRNHAILARKFVPSTHAVGGQTFAIGDVIRQRLSQGPVAGEALSPRLSLEVQWIDAPACRAYAMLNYPMSVSVAGRQVGTITPGHRSYTFDLAHATSDVMSPPGDGVTRSDAVELTAAISFEAPYADPSQYAHVSPREYIEEIPAQCAVVVSKPRIGFDPVAARREIERVQAQGLLALDLLSAQTVIHGYLLDGAHGALCGIDRIAVATQRAVQETTGELVPLSHLKSKSLSAHMAILNALWEAQNQDALPPEAQADPWQWFVTNQPSVHQQCVSRTAGAPPIGAPSEDAFVGYPSSTRIEGELNAQQYAKTLKQFQALQTEAWALAVAARIGVVADPDKQWMVRTP